MAGLGRIMGMWLIVMILAGTGPSTSRAMVPKCEVVYELFPACLEFLVGWTNKMDHECCINIEKLNIEAKYGIGAKEICWCIEFMVRGQQQRIQNSQVSKLTSACHTQHSFPISEYMDCDKIN